MMLPLMVRKEGLLWKAYPMLEVPVHTDECDDPECRGGLVPTDEPIAQAFTERRMRRKVLHWVRAQALGEVQKAASESLGG